jgi:hypothetical protein
MGTSKKGSTSFSKKRSKKLLFLAVETTRFNNRHLPKPKFFDSFFKKEPLAYLACSAATGAGARLITLAPTSSTASVTR